MTYSDQMELDPAVCYRAVRARDIRYDGRFFTCVKTTGIYCRPICPARPPKLENCCFVPTAAAAQKAGFRPCLRCRPESSPDLDAWHGSSAMVSRALKLIEGGALDEGDVASLTDRLEIGERQLRRLFRRHLGAAPITVAQTRRVLLAKQLLHQTDLSMIEGDLIGVSVQKWPARGYARIANWGQGNCQFGSVCICLQFDRC
jgi:AraC family transcriptional regulator, regulatory protein of adaptative response / DNA-3-methyladenine glycosylase II